MERALEIEIDDVRELKDRIAELEGFAKSARHALQLLDDGYFREAAAQLRASFDHLEFLQKSEPK